MLEDCQLLPPSIEYWIALPIGELAVIVIVPSATPQSVISVPTALVNTGGVLSSRTSVGPVTSQPPPAFLTAISYDPPAKPVNIFDDCHVPPFSEYSSAPFPMAVTVIVPSTSPQLVGLVEATFVMLGADGDVRMIGLFASGVSQEPSVFLTNTLYVPSPRLEKVFEDCQLMPPSIEYSMLAPVAVITIEPSATPQLVGLVGVTPVMTGCILSIKITFGLDCSQVPSAFLTRIS